MSAAVKAHPIVRQYLVLHKARQMAWRISGVQLGEISDSDGMGMVLGRGMEVASVGSIF